MAKKIIRFPGQASRWMLRVIGVMVTFVFTFFVYTSGQVIQSAGLGKSSTKAGANSAALSADTNKVVPDYGVSPLYGIIVEYGMPHAYFSIKGKIRAEAGDAGIPNIKVSVTDTSNKIVIDSAVTQADGSFSMAFMGVESPVFNNTWLLDVRDVDGSQNGAFASKDTLITIPLLVDSLTGGVGEADIELFLKNSAAVIVPDGDAAKQQPRVTVSWATNGAMDLRYTLAVQGRAAISLFSADGKLVREISDTWESSGEHNVMVASAGLAPGAYFLKLQTAAHAAITKVMIAR